MNIKNLFKRKKTIRKPSWAVSVLVFVVILGLAGHLVYLGTEETVVEQFGLGDATDIFTYVNMIENYGVDGFSDNEIEELQEKITSRLTMYMIPAIITVDGQELCNSSYNFVYFVSYSDNIEKSAELKMMHWDPETDTGYQKLYEYMLTPVSLFKSYSCSIGDFYYNDETGDVIPGTVEVYANSTLYIILGELGFGHLLGEDKFVEAIDLTPSDKTLLEGMRHIDNHYDTEKECYPNEFHLMVPSICGSAENGRNVYYQDWYFGGEQHSLFIQYNYEYEDYLVTPVSNFWAWFIAIAVVILALICGTIIYLLKRNTYNIFEYRRKTTNAMAHDLKTPLAIASLSVANLKENLNTNNERAEYHANEIDDSIKHMDQLICNILDFSNSESGDRKLTKEKVDVGAELKAYAGDIGNVLTSRKLTLDISGDAERMTDRKIWNQAMFNLIDNAAKYASEGSTIKVALGEKEITVSNSVEKDIANADKLIEPFVKGDDSRGENAGSGLGLAIAHNNFKALGYKMKVTCENKIFAVRIK